MATASEDATVSERCCCSYSPSAYVNESDASSERSAPTTSTCRFSSRLFWCFKAGVEVTADDSNEVR
jgi:hypothetical protein